MRKPTEVTCGPETPQSTVLSQGTANVEAQLLHQQSRGAAAMLLCGRPQGMSWGARSHGCHTLARGHTFTLERASGSWGGRKSVH